MQYLRKLIQAVRHPLLCIFACFLCGCEGTTFRSSVPAYPVHAVIDTRAEFIDFTPENLNAYITIDKDGYKKNGKFVRLLTVQDYWGYGGIVVYVSMAGYVAFDLACPACALKAQKSPCEMHGMYAVCPVCGEEYELGSGYALPRNHISKEALRKLRITHSGDKLIISQQ